MEEDCTEVANSHSLAETHDTLGKFRVQAIERAFRIIDVIASHAHTSLSLTEIAEGAGLHVSTAYRIMQNLLHWHYVRESSAGRYQLGWQFVHLSSKLQSGTSLIGIASPYLHVLGDKTGQTVYLTALTDNSKQVLYLYKVESKGAIQLSSGVGTKNRVYSTAAGKSLLSNWDEENVLSLLQEIEMVPLTANTITSPQAFLAEIKKTAELGYSLDIEENENSVICISAPIHDCLGNNIAAVSLSGVYSTNDFARIQGQYIALTVETAKIISSRMGFMACE